MKAVILLLLVTPIFAIDDYIVGGTTASAGEWPWQGVWQQNGGFICGCVLVHQRWVLTAGHCVGGPAGSYTMRFGSTNVNGGTQFSNTGVTRHPNYDSGPIGVATPNDVTVVGISGVSLGSNINIVPGGIDTGIDRTSQTCYITGWGKTCGLCSTTTSLMEVQIPVISDAQCETEWGASFDPQYHICVFGPTQSSCNGDSGGPLVCRSGTSDSWDLIGVTSWGNAGCTPDDPSVYTRLENYRSWICSNTGGDVCY